MQNIKPKYGWTFFIRGCLAAFFGFFTIFMWPILELGSLTANFFGVYILIQGVLALIVYINIKKSRFSWPVMLEGVLGIVIGSFLLLLTDFTRTLFVVSFITWGIGTGICKVIRAVIFYKEQGFYVVLGINGLLSILFNMMIFIQAEVTNRPIDWILSIYFIVYGVLMIILGFTLVGPKDED